VHPRRLDVLHDAADVYVLSVGDGVHVVLEGVLEKPIHQDRPLRTEHRRLRQKRIQIGRGVRNRHAPAAEDERGSDKDGISDLLRSCPYRLGSSGHAVLRLPQSESSNQPGELLPILGVLDTRDTRSDDAPSRRLEFFRHVEGRLPPELHHHIGNALLPHDRDHVFRGEGLDIEAVGYVEVRRDRLRVGVDHHRSAPEATERHRREGTARVELQALPDPIGSTPHDEHPGGTDGFALILLAPGRVEVRRLRLELPRTGIDEVVARCDPRRDPRRSDVRHRYGAAGDGRCGAGLRRPAARTVSTLVAPPLPCGTAHQPRDPAVRESRLLRLQEEIRRQIRHRSARFGPGRSLFAGVYSGRPARGGKPRFKLRQPAKLVEKPAVIPAHRSNALRRRRRIPVGRHRAPQEGVDRKDPARMERLDHLPERRVSGARRGPVVAEGAPNPLRQLLESVEAILPLRESPC
jgi:hypothetical protein